MEFENLLTLIQAVSDSELTGLQYEENGLKLHLSKKQGRMQAVSGCDVRMAVETETDSGEEGTPENDGERIVRSPLVGIFYAAPAEDAEPYVRVGDKVKKGQTMAIVEAMKLMNEIESDFDGTVAEICVENGQTVEYGQPLFCIR